MFLQEATNSYAEQENRYRGPKNWILQQRIGYR